VSARLPAHRARSVRYWLASVVFFWTVLLLGGCATPQVSRLAQALPAGLPLAAGIEGVPFFPQEAFQCGPAALAMLAQHAGVQVNPDDIRPQVYLPGRFGSLQVEILAATRRQALLPYVLAPALEDLLREVAAGHPVLVLQNLSFSFAPIWHYAVVIGYDRMRNSITQHSGVTAGLTMSLSTFERVWARGGHWAVVALSPSRLPATATPSAFMTAARSLERVSPAAAQQAYATVTRVWPEERGGWLGLGNAAHAQGQLDQAASAFAEATRQLPDFADAWNNLAQVRYEQSRWQDAAQAIERAVALGGPRVALYRELQSAVRAALAAP
jgi:hypothetical protein